MKDLLGKKVKCSITGFQGVAKEYHEVLDGRAQFKVQPAVVSPNEEMKLPKAEWMQESHLDEVE